MVSVSQQTSGDLVKKDAEGGLVFQTGACPMPQSNGQTPTLHLPVKVNDQVIGVLSLNNKDLDEGWTDAEIHALEMLAERLGIVLETTRLYPNPQPSRADRERMISEFSGRIRQTLDIDQILMTAVREIYYALDLHDVSIHLQPEDHNNSHPDSEISVRGG